MSAKNRRQEYDRLIAEGRLDLIPKSLSDEFGIVAVKTSVSIPSVVSKRRRKK